MKKIKLLFAITVCSCKLNSQPYYGEGLYNQGQNNELTTAINISSGANIGFLLGGTIPLSTSLGVPNFILNKLSSDGTLTGGGNTFSKSYQIFGNNACTSSPASANNCAGISVKEYVSTTSAMRYAVAGAFDDGCFFVSLNNTGTVLNKTFYTFPATSSQASKPVLVVSNGLIFIIGSFKSTLFNSRQLYILKVSQTGSFLQSKSYNMAQICPNPGQCPCGPYGYDLVPNDAIISPFPSAYQGVTSELIIVGEATKYGNYGPFCLPVSESSAFLLRAGSNNLTVYTSHLYDYATSSTAGHNGFNAIAAAPNPLSPEGFIVGGYSDYNPGFGLSWMLKIDHQSAVPFWSSLLSSTYGNGSSFVSGVAYRNSSAYGETYYGVLAKGNGAVVTKLNAFGSPFTCTPAIDNKNEFNYLIGSNATINSNQITINTTAASANEGIHVYGNGNNNQFFLSRATFNGVSNFSLGCSTSANNNGLITAQGPLNIRSRAINPNPPGILTLCSNFNVTSTNISPSTTLPCQLSGSLPTNGSNNRSALTTEINNSDPAMQSDITIFPNPSNGIITISSSTENELMKVKILDVTGKVVYSKEVKNNASNRIDVSSLKASIYFIEIQNSNNKTVRKKLIIE
jgi:hypothetical protein